VTSAISQRRGLGRKRLHRNAPRPGLSFGNDHLVAECDHRKGLDLDESCHHENSCQYDGNVILEHHDGVFARVLPAWTTMRSDAVPDNAVPADNRTKECHWENWSSASRAAPATM
jgi:hypothetical protein